MGAGWFLLVVAVAVALVVWVRRMGGRLGPAVASGIGVVLSVISLFVGGSGNRSEGFAFFGAGAVLLGAGQLADFKFYARLDREFGAGRFNKWRSVERNSELTARIVGGGFIAMGVLAIIVALTGG